MSDLIVYGSYGYTGNLIVEEALAKGLRPVLAGRSREKLEAQAARLELPMRVASVEDSDALDAVLADGSVVIHCAGPFAHKAKQMAEACIRAKTHYLDITGEISVFEEMAALDKQAQAAGVMLLPGAGFDVVPSDCLALHLKERLPSATHLVLAISSNGSASQGTAKTMAENLPHGGMVRENGQLKRVPAAHKIRSFDFGKGDQRAMATPWGDVSTAYYTTGIPNIEVYMALPRAVQIAAKASRFIGPLLATGPAQRFMKSRIEAGPAGPSDDARTRGYAILIGEVADASGKRATARLKTPDGYTLTAQSAVCIARKALAGDAPAGFQTPGKAYGKNLVMELPGVTREDLEG
jgi:short subunit dehydrogenase-like uncharacterized protein